MKFNPPLHPDRQPEQTIRSFVHSTQTRKPHSLASKSALFAPSIDADKKFCQQAR